MLAALYLMPTAARSPLDPAEHAYDTLTSCVDTLVYELNAAQISQNLPRVQRILALLKPSAIQIAQLQDVAGASEDGLQCTHS